MNAPRTTDEFVRFWNTYYGDEIAALAQNYPTDSYLEVDHSDVFQWDSDIALDWLDAPGQVQQWFKQSLSAVNTGGIDLEDVTIGLVNIPEDHVYSPNEIRNEHAEGYIGVSGDLSRITTPDDFAEEIAWECERCGTLNYIPQDSDELQEPYECKGCERQGPFQIDDGGSSFIDYSKVRISTPPEKAGNQGTDSIDGYVTGDLVEHGHEDGLIQRAGDRAILYGEIERIPKSSGRKKKPLFERRFNIQAIKFRSEQETVDIDAHKAEFERLAARDDAVEIFQQSIAPELYATDAWQAALKLGVAYLFGAPRLDVPDGPTYRGDIHGLLITDYGMGKSTFNEGLEQYSPKCISKSATGLSSDVGLLAAAVKDDFGDGQWTIKPGILVRGNGGHVILDEIDKPDADLSQMNDAIEGQQKVDVEKAGQSATYQSRVGLMATGNPEESRFTDYEVIADQIGINETLLSRFDGVITMRDKPDIETDANIAERILDGIAEASEFIDGERDEFDVLDRPVPVDVGKAWIKYAREEVQPVAKREHLEEIKEWYSQEVRQLNKQFADSGSGEDMPVPVTPRVIENTFRMAAAFARIKLKDEITSEDVEDAKDIVREMIKQEWNGDHFGNANAPSPKTQHEKIEAVQEALEPEQAKTPAEIAESAGVDESTAEKLAEKMCNKNPAQATKPAQGVYRGV
jgi:replicative DNA helicase Mcm